MSCNKTNVKMCKNKGNIYSKTNVLEYTVHNTPQTYNVIYKTSPIQLCPFNNGLLKT